MTETGLIPTLAPGARLDQATKRELLAFLERDARHLCARFGLRYRVLEAERANVKRRYGVCFSDGTIRIRLRHAATGRALKYSSLVNTLCHELAHLRHFNHGPHFQALYGQILECARRDGIYKPKAAVDTNRPAVIRTAASAPVRAPSGSIRQTRPAGPESRGRDGREVPTFSTNARQERPAAMPTQLELFSSFCASASVLPHSPRTPRTR